MDVTRSKPFTQDELDARAAAREDVISCLLVEG
jgi:hypothetical protein